MAELRDPFDLGVWRAPAGVLTAWVRHALGLACIASVALPLAGARTLWHELRDRVHTDPFWSQNGLALLAFASIVALAVPKWHLTRWLRIAVVLPVLHLVLVAVAWPVWLQIRAEVEDTSRMFELSSALPLTAVIAGELAVIGAAAAWLGRGRRDSGPSHAFAMIALCNLLLLGLWLPLVAWAECRGGWRVQIDPAYALAHPTRLAALVVAPPLAASIAVTAIALAAPGRYRGHALGMLVTLMLVAIVLRVDAVPAARVVYAHFIHVLLGAVVVAASCPLILGLAMWRRARIARRSLESSAGAITGTIVCATERDEVEGDAVACFEIASWLRPPRSLVRSFVLATPAGEVPVSGARLVAPLDPATTALARGESFAALREGDRVTIAGLPGSAPTGDPFRGTAAPIIGTDPLLAPYGMPRLAFSDLALALWRPTVAYLVILVVVAAPALAALASASY